jgi:hypothetical protein
LKRLKEKFELVTGSRRVGARHENCGNRDLGGIRKEINVASRLGRCSRPSGRHSLAQYRSLTRQYGGADDHFVSSAMLRRRQTTKGDGLSHKGQFLSPRSGAFPCARKPDASRRGLNSFALRAPGKRAFGCRRERSTAVFRFIRSRAGSKVSAPHPSGSLTSAGRRYRGEFDVPYCAVGGARRVALPTNAVPIVEPTVMAALRHPLPRLPPA